MGPRQSFCYFYERASPEGILGRSLPKIAHMHVMCASACDLAHGRKDNKKPLGEQWVDSAHSKDLVLSLLSGLQERLDQVLCHTSDLLKEKFRF